MRDGQGEMGDGHFEKIKVTVSNHLIETVRKLFTMKRQGR